MRWWCTACLNPEKEDLRRTPSGRKLHRCEKRGTNELTCAVNLDFGSLIGKGLLEERLHPGVAGECRRTL